MESVKSMDEPPKDYEAMLQKYEAEVRNHIKIEQQLKLHIECVQDKLDDSEKAREKMKHDLRKNDEDTHKDMQRYKDLLGLREKEVDSLKNEYKRVLKLNEDLKLRIKQLEVGMSQTPLKGGAKSSLEELSYHGAHLGEAHTTDNRQS